MRLTLFFSIIACLLFSCKPNLGSLSGNAYWKYNDYVGNKPDAGAEVFLFSQDTSKQPQKATCDVEGNFSFVNIPTGDYLLVAKSKATTASSPEEVNELLNYLCTPIIDFCPNDKPDITHQFIDAYYSLKKFDIALLGTNKNKKDEDSLNYYRFQTTLLADSIFNKISNNSPLKIWVYHFGLKSNELPIDDKVEFKGNFAGQKVKIEDVKIEKDKMQTVVIDFGATYL